MSVLVESLARPGVLHWGDGDERVERIRDAYRKVGPSRLRERLTPRQRDVLGVLRVAEEPLSLRELFEIFDALPRTWIDHGSSGLQLAMKPLEARGLVERISVPKVGNGPKFKWRATEAAVVGEALVSKRDPRELAGVGQWNGRAYRRIERRELRPTRKCAVCHGQFRSTHSRETCSDACEALREGRAERQEELEALMAIQGREQRRDEYVEGEWPQGSRSVYTPRAALPLDAPGTDAARRENDWGSSYTGHDKHELLQHDSPEVELDKAEKQERMAEILGDLDEDAVARLDDHTLQHLRERLREEGLVDIAVPRRERERLRNPARNRGGAPPPEHQRMSTKLKHREPGHKSSAGGRRGSRKPKKRWELDPDGWA